jgi:hypothetical protein
MKVSVSRSWTGKLWHIRSLNGRSLCGVNVRDLKKELEITDRRICPKCKDTLYNLLSKKRQINQILKIALP